VRPRIRRAKLAVSPGPSASAAHRQVAWLSVGSTQRFYQIDPAWANAPAVAGPP
jgi:hypothetical protein